MSAPNFNRLEDYRLTLATGEVDRTTWWKDENRREPANVWWLEGPGISRPATDIEINLWLQKHGIPEPIPASITREVALAAVMESDKILQHYSELSAVRGRRIDELEAAIIKEQKRRKRNR